MNQLFTSALYSGLLLALCSCHYTSPCKALIGRWTTREGQDFIFQSGGKALWLFQFGSSFDTAYLDYRLDCSQKPAALDLSNFKNGPHLGKTLYGIIEWSSDSTFRLRYEPGTVPEVRPAAFDNEQSLKFHKVDEGY